MPNVDHSTGSYRGTEAENKCMSIGGVGMLTLMLLAQFQRLDQCRGLRGVCFYSLLLGSRRGGDFASALMNP